MKIYKCPLCVELLHFEPTQPVQCCWNCGEVTDFSSRLTRFDRFLPDVPRLKKAGRVALVVTLPLAIGMMLFSNSIDAQPRGTFTDRFNTPGFHPNSSCYALDGFGTCGIP